MTIDVTDAPPPVCTAPSFGDRREIWSGTVTVEHDLNGVLELLLVTDSAVAGTGSRQPLAQSGRPDLHHWFEQLS